MKELLCPICTFPLFINGQAKLETLSEHICNLDDVCLKDKYQCSNEACEAFKDELVWTENGEYFGAFAKGVPFRKKYAFVDNNNGPFNSFQRATNVKVYKKDENKTLFELFRFRVDKEYTYDADTSGNVTKREWKLRYWIRSKDKDNPSYTSYIPGIHMFFFSLRDFKNKRERWEKNKPNIYIRSELHDEFFPRWKDDRWWKRLSTWYFNFFYRALRTEIVRPNKRCKEEEHTFFNGKCNRCGEFIN